MLDIKYIRENKKEIEAAVKNKNLKVDIGRLLELDEKRKAISAKEGELRAKRNEHTRLMSGGKPTSEQIKEGKRFKTEISKLNEKMSAIMPEYEELMAKVPTIPAKDTPIGKDADENVEIETQGTIREFKFKPKSHIELANKLDIIDFERGVKVSGYRGYYMKNEGAQLQMALMMYAIEKLVQAGFTFMIPPTLVREFVLFGSGYFAGKKYNEDIDEIYRIANKDIEADGAVNKDDKFLIGTAEPSLLAYHANEILAGEKLPLKYCGFSPCYRSEIGSYGKDTKGLYRVHEFMKVEQVVLVEADIKVAEKLHQEMLEISKGMHADLGIPYRVLRICSGDMSAGKYKMFDLEAWMPGRGAYGETGSASNFMDWQSRRLNVRYTAKDGTKKYVYMLNNTAIPSPRFVIAILENFQNEDGSVTIPAPLRKYMPGNIEKITR